MVTDHPRQCPLCGRTYTVFAWPLEHQPKMEQRICPQCRHIDGHKYPEAQDGWDELNRGKP